MAQASSEISQITLDNVTYDIKDTTARQGGGGGGGVLPRLIITSDAGSTITVSKGQTTATVTPLTSTTWQCDVNAYGTWTVTSALSGEDDAVADVVVDEVKIYEVDASHIKIYGAEWDGSSSPAWSRTDAAELFTDPSPAVNNGTGSSPFDNISPWSGMTKVEDSVAGTLVQIPKYYYKWTRTGSKMKLQVSMKRFEGSYVSPAHADRGDGEGERDVVYVGRYHCAQSTYKSTTGVLPQASLTRADFRTNIHNLGSDIWQNDFAMFWTIRMLYLVEYANWNSQEKIGHGCSANSAIQVCGLTDSMQYHTGTNAADRINYGAVQYRNIEGLWSQMIEFVDGIYFSNGTNINCIKNPSNFSDTTGGTRIGLRSESNGYISSFTNPSSVEGFEYALYPNSNNGSASTYICDNSNYEYSGVCVFVNGGPAQGIAAGLFAMCGNINASYKHAYTGSRLMKLPNNS